MNRILSQIKEITSEISTQTFNLIDEQRNSELTEEQQKVLQKLTKTYLEMLEQFYIIEKNLESSLLSEEYKYSLAIIGGDVDPQTSLLFGDEKLLDILVESLNLGHEKIVLCHEGVAIEIELKTSHNFNKRITINTKIEDLFKKEK